MNILIVKTDPPEEELIWIKKEIQKISLERIKSKKSVCIIKERSLESLKFNSIKDVDFIFTVGECKTKSRVIVEALTLCALFGNITCLNDKQKTILVSRVIYFDKETDRQPKNRTDVSLFKLTNPYLENVNEHLVEFTGKSFLEKILNEEN